MLDTAFTVSCAITIGAGVSLWLDFLVEGAMFNRPPGLMAEWLLQLATWGSVCTLTFGFMLLIDKVL